MTARELKDRLAARHPARDANGFIGAWTCVEEWMNIDLLAIAAWDSLKSARVGYEVKVSRSDYKRELAKPYKRRRAVDWTNEFYFAIPYGLLRTDELIWEEPVGWPDDRDPFKPEKCPGAYGSYCSVGSVKFGTHPRRGEYGRDPGPSRPAYMRRYHLDYSRTYDALCPTCRGTGEIAPSPVERAGAPKLWVPNDVGLIEVGERSCRIVRPSPKRREVPALSPRNLGQFARWVSVRPDPRHANVGSLETDEVSEIEVPEIPEAQDVTLFRDATV